MLAPAVTSSVGTGELGARVGPLGVSVPGATEPWVPPLVIGGPPESDDMEGDDYVPNTPLHGHEGGGLHWAGPWVARTAYISVYAEDSMESYTDTATVDGLNGLSGWDAPWVARTAYVSVYADESGESYADGDFVNGLNGGAGTWTGTWRALPDAPIIDSMETYSDGALNTLNGGSRWNGAYSARTAYISVYMDDTMESYAVGGLNGLNGGNGWSGPYRGGDPLTYAHDEMEAYADAADVNGLNGGLLWTGAFVARNANISVRGYDNMESYADGATLNTLNGGTWGSAYVAR